MNRRHFLGATAAGLALTAAPRWIQQAFAGEPSSRTLVFDAYRRARRDQRALLVFIIPANPEQQWPRGRAIGAFLTYGSDAQLAPLARCEVVCATAAHVHALVPAAPAGEPLAMLIDTTAVPASIRPITVKLDDPEALRDDPAMSRDWEAMQSRANELVMANVARIGAALHAALGAADPKLAAQVRARLSKHDVPGARWASSGGCATTFEHPEKGDEDAGAIGCGMGFVPEKSRRFLYLLASSKS
jgi:hypothetical protein